MQWFTEVRQKIYTVPPVLTVKKLQDNQENYKSFIVFNLMHRQVSTDNSWFHCNAIYYGTSALKKYLGLNLRFIYLNGAQNFHPYGLDSFNLN